MCGEPEDVPRREPCPSARCAQPVNDENAFTPLLCQCTFIFEHHRCSSNLDLTSTWVLRMFWSICFGPDIDNRPNLSRPDFSLDSTLNTTLSGAHAPAGTTSLPLRLNLERRAERMWRQRHLRIPAKKRPRLKLDVRIFADGLADRVANRDSRLHDLLASFRLGKRTMPRDGQTPSCLQICLSEHPNASMRVHVTALSIGKLGSRLCTACTICFLCYE